jgi:hypothetical protein
MDAFEIFFFAWCFALAGACLWVITRPYSVIRQFSRARGRAQLALIISVALIGVGAYFEYRQWRAPAELSEYLPVYPRYLRSTFVPTVDQRPSIRTWMFFTPDTVKQVMDFHRDEQNRHGWTLRPSKSHASLLTLERGDLRMVIGAGTMGEETTILYELQRRPAQDAGQG